MNIVAWMTAGLLVAVFSGCGTTNLEAGYSDSQPYDDGRQPASLFEMQFGAGQTEVTKNIPGDAAHSVGAAVKSLRTKPEPEQE